MKIIDQSYKILSLPNNILGRIEQIGRVCYKSEDKIGCTLPKDQTPEKCPDRLKIYNDESITEILTEILEFTGCDNKCEHHSSQKFVKMLRDRGHDAMLEFGDITVRFTTNRGVTHELVRHRLFSFAQESTRYVRYDGGMEFIRPVWVTSKEILGQHTIEWVDLIGMRFEGQINPELLPAENVWFWNQAIAERDYCNLLDCGWRPEQAREVLPNSLKTEIVVKGNIRQWIHCLKLRTSKKAHPQIRNLMLPLLDELQERVPVVFDDIRKGK